MYEYDLSNISVSSDLEWPLSCVDFKVTAGDALDELCAQLTRDLFGIAKIVFKLRPDKNI